MLGFCNDNINHKNGFLGLHPNLDLAFCMTFVLIGIIYRINFFMVTPALFWNFRIDSIIE